MTGDVRVVVDRPPDPGLLRPALEAALAGRPWPAGPEAAVAGAVAARVAAETGRADRPQTGPAAGTEQASAGNGAPRW